MNKLKIAVLDDYQNAALESARLEIFYPPGERLWLRRRGMLLGHDAGGNAEGAGENGPPS